MNKIWYAPHKKDAYGDREIKAVIECLNEGWLAGFGKYTIDFEEKVSKMFGKEHGLFVNSGSSACLLALACLDLPENSEIITPACTFSTTVAPIIQLKLKPVFVDVELKTYVPSVDKILEKINDKTHAIMIPNLVGNLPDWKSLKEELKKLQRDDIILIEDSADTIIYSPYSDISTTSFYSSHIITACGSGGMVMFNNKKYLQRALMFRDWGRIGDNSECNTERYQYDVDGIPYDYKFLYGVHGYNMKSSEVNAAFGLVQLERFEEFKLIRRRNFERYLMNLQDISEIVLPDDKYKPNWLAIPLQCDKRLELLNFLEDNNIQTRVLFAGNITRHPAYRTYFEEFENADIIMKNGFLLGCHHAMSITDVDYVCNKIKEFYGYSKTVANIIKIEDNPLPELAFLFPRHVRSVEHKDIWKECLRCIRRHYKTEPVIIIDDNSDKKMIEPLVYDEEWMMNNVSVIQSEYIGAGEILPFYYFHKLKPAKKAVIINDSMFIQKPFDDKMLKNLKHIKFLWSFDCMISVSPDPYISYNQYEIFKNILKSMTTNTGIIKYMESKKWEGCFASSCILTSEFMDILESKYNFSEILVNIINNRTMRQILERIIGIIGSYELQDKCNELSLYNSIYNVPYAFEYSFNDYKKNPVNIPVIKCWNSR